MFRKLVLALILAQLALTVAPALLEAGSQAPVRWSFADFLLFTNWNTTPDGGAVWFTSSSYLDGWVHTNDEFRFMGAPHFGDTVTCAGRSAWYYNNGDPVELADSHNGTLDVPTFARGFVRGVAPIALPANSYNQQWAALGLDPTNSNAPTVAQVRWSLGLGAGTTAPPTGVYLPVNPGDGTVSGGIYIQGDADRLIAVADTIHHRQEFRVTQGSTTKSVVIDPAAFTVTVAAGSNSTVYTGIPRGVIYVDGAIHDFGGPGRIGAWIPSALAGGQQWSVVATGDVVVQSDFTHERFDTGWAVAGVFSSGGSVRVGSLAPGDVHLEMFVMATGASGSFAVDGYAAGAPRGGLYLRGGCSEQYNGAFGTIDSNGYLAHGYTRFFSYDRRGWIPPYWPPAWEQPLDATAPRAVAAALSLATPYPNPARSSMRIRYTLPRAGRVRLSMFDVLGRRIDNLVDAIEQPGEHEASWTRGRVGVARVRAGLYFLQLEAAGARVQSRVVLLD